MTTTGTPHATPLVRKLAAMHAVDLTTVPGTGVGGRIRKQDVLAAAGEPTRVQPFTPATSTAPQTQPFSTGDLPPFTASGVDPSALAALPPYLRPAAAASTDRGEVLRMIQQVAAIDAADGVATAELGDVSWIRRVWPTVWPT